MRPISPNCPNCGASHGPTNKFCEYCGSRIITQSAKQEDINPDFHQELRHGGEPQQTYINGILALPGEERIRADEVGKYTNGFVNQLGQLLLTNKRLAFMSNRNVTVDLLSLSEIEKVYVCRPLIPLIHSYIEVRDKAGRNFRYNVVSRPREWVESISAAMRNFQ